jgi:hypothetical protein
MIPFLVPYNLDVVNLFESQKALSIVQPFWWGDLPPR